mmetsp:Transcript_12933/g.33902  ORF Transcript_12933/g.33902 Transcript_12933/m.33902 type:complete len:240 (+) Transcript_12933:1329-2048(+)
MVRRDAERAHHEPLHRRPGGRRPAAVDGDGQLDRDERRGVCNSRARRRRRAARAHRAGADRRSALLLRHGGVRALVARSQAPVERAAVAPARERSGGAARRGDVPCDARGGIRRVQAGAPAGGDGAPDVPLPRALGVGPADVDAADGRHRPRRLPLPRRLDPPRDAAVGARGARAHVRLRRALFARHRRLLLRQHVRLSHLAREGPRVSPRAHRAAAPLADRPGDRRMAGGRRDRVPRA